MNILLCIMDSVCGLHRLKFNSDKLVNISTSVKTPVHLTPV